MKDIIKGIIIGIVSSLITSGIIYGVTKKIVWNATLPLWIWLSISFGLVLLVYIIRIVILKYRIKILLSEFTEGIFGDSYVYTWKYKRSRNGRYSVYGYEATDICTKKSLSEMNNKNVFTCGHEVPEETIKMFIQLTIIANVNKKMGKKLLPLIEYLQWTENSQYHTLLH